MCGIFGVRWSFLRSLQDDPGPALQQALQRLRWRGPDGQGLVRCGDFVLGCTRLAITQRRSRQPVVRRGGRHAAVCNGAVTSATREWERLCPRLLRRQTLPNDAWLPLLLVERGETQRLDGLHGHRALAVVDAEQDRLVLARDRAGEKPLFVVRQGSSVVAFASTLPALGALGIETGLDAAAVRRFFTFGSAGAPVALQPGLQLGADLAGVQDSQEGPAGAVHEPATPPAAGASPEQAKALAQALQAATARCAAAAKDQPVALSLSGGLDSSCLASLLQGQQVPAYQFRAAGCDAKERQLAQQVARHCGLPFRPVDGGPEVLEALPQLTRLWGMPLGDPSVLAVHALARAAARDGVRILLSGEGADDALLGYDRHRAVARLRWLARARWRAVRWPAFAMGRPARLLRAALGGDPYAELLAVSPPGFRAAVLAPPFAAAGELPATAATDPLERARQLDFGFYLRWDLLPKLDVATMAAGIEGRCPFLDAEVLAVARATPAAAALGKRPLRASFAARLPLAVLRQKKRGFALPLDRWFRGGTFVLDLLREPATRQREHLRPGGIDAAIDRHRRGRADLGHALYLLGAYELYLRAREASR